MSEWGTGQVTGGKLYCRKQPIARYEPWGRFDNNATIPIKVYNTTWYETYWGGNTNNVGYVMSKFITNESWEGGSTGDAGTTTAPSLETIRNGDAYLKIGDAGSSVTTLRSLLNSKGYICASSGAYDDSLKSVVKNFQANNGVKADGLAGQITFALLEDNVSDTGWFSGQGTCCLTAGKLARIGFTGKLILRPANIARLNSAINDLRFDFTEKIHIRHFLAQGCKETDLGKTFTEYTYHEGWSKSQYNGKPRYAPYCGGGFMQLTHYSNYKSFEDFIEDFQICSHEGYATKYVAEKYPFISAAWFWCKRNDEGKGLNQIIDSYNNRSADATVKKVTATVKGSSSGYKVRLGYYNKAKAVLK